jgi:hypothetical protein
MRSVDGSEMKTFVNGLNVFLTNADDHMRNVNELHCHAIVSYMTGSFDELKASACDDTLFGCLFDKA